MSLTSRIQDQKDHITQAKKDLCSKVGVPSEPLPSFSEIIHHYRILLNLISKKLTKRGVLHIIYNLFKGHG